MAKLHIVARHNTISLAYLSSGNSAELASLNWTLQTPIIPTLRPPTFNCITINPNIPFQWLMLWHRRRQCPEGENERKSAEARRGRGGFLANMMAAEGALREQSICRGISSTTRLGSLHVRDAGHISRGEIYSVSIAFFLGLYARV